MQVTGEQFIGSKRSAAGTKTFAAGNAEHKFYEATEEEINEAAQKAADAFLLYRNFNAEKKISFLEATAAGIETNRTSLLHTAMQETFLAEARLNGEIN